jgi:uncharacterized membrane protein YsdA (DUF1294 family)
MIGLIFDIFFVSAAILSTTFFTRYLYDSTGQEWVVAYLLAINLTAFAFAIFDRFVCLVLPEAIRPRVPEGVLIWVLGFPGGMAGLLLALTAAGHKVSDEKRDFRTEMVVALVLSLLAAFALWRAGILTLESANNAVAAVVTAITGPLDAPL